MTLEQQLLALMEQHDLTSLSINVMMANDDGPTHIYSYAHGGGQCGSSGHFGCDAAAAVGSAIGDLNAKRFPPSVPVELAPMENAA